MKKFTKIVSCLTAAALICSAGAFSACGSNVVSDEVTAEEWEAAFADENFYNVTINCVGSYTEERNGTYYDGDNNISSYGKEKYSSVYDSTYKYDLTSTDEIMTGKIYSYRNAKGENQYEYEFADYPEYNQNTDETGEYTYYEYYLYDEQGYDYAGKSVDDGEDGEWYTYSRSYPWYADYFYLSSNITDYYLPIVIGIARDCEFEYKDGAYVHTYAYDESNFIEEEIKESGYEYDVTEFTGGAITYSVIIKDGKVYSLKYDYSYTFGMNVYYSDSYIVSYESYSVTYEWTFSDYGTTSVTVPDEVTALFE